MNLFKEAIFEMFNQKEFDSLLNTTRNPIEKKRIKKDYENLSDIRKRGMINFPSIPMLMSIKSKKVLKDIVSIMITLEKREKQHDK